MKQFYFSETQYFRQFWIWGLAIVALGLVLTGTVLAIKDLSWKGNFGSLILGSLFYIIPIFITVLLINMRLETKLDPDGVIYRLYPVHIRERIISWEEVNTVYIRKYNPFLEYGGLGWGYSMRNGKAFNISGNWGLQIIFKDGRKLLLGTQKYIELEELVGQLFKTGLIQNVTPVKE